MVIHDISTTISCDRCSDEFTVSGNFSEKAMRTLAKKDGWKLIRSKDVCPKCNEYKKRKDDNNGV